MPLSDRIATGLSLFEPLVQQRLADAAHRAVGLAVFQGSPGSGGIPLGEKHPLGRLVRPLQQPFGDAAGVGGELLRRAQQHAAVGPLLERGLRGGELHAAGSFFAMDSHGRDAAQVRVPHLRNDSARFGVELRQRLLEFLHRPLQPAHQELDLRARALHGDRLIVELAGGVAVGHAGLLDQLADQGAVVRLVGLDRAQHLPVLRVPRERVHVDDQGLGAGALGFEHLVQKVSGV